MIAKHRVLFLIFAFFAIFQCNLVSVAQQKTGIPPSISLRKLIYNQDITNNNGLNTSNVTCVLQTSDGYIWLTSFDGIFRYDGVNFEMYNKNNTIALQQNAFYEIVQRNDDELLFLSNGRGIIKYKNGKFLEYEHNDKLPKSINGIYVDGNNTLWVACDGAIYYETKGVVQQIENEIIENAEILNAIEGKNGVMYFGTEGNGIFKFDGTTVHQLYSEGTLRSNTFITAERGNDGELFFGSFDGAKAIKNDSSRIISYLEDTRVNDMYFDDFENLFFATDGGLFRINEKHKIYEKVLDGNYLPSHEVKSIDLDREGSIWLGIEKEGLVQLKQSKFESYLGADGLSLDKINTVHQKSEKEFWIGSDNGNIDILNIEKNTITKFKFETDLKNKGIRDVLYDKDGETIWIASYSGLLMIKNGKEKLYTETEGLSSQLARCLLQDKNGDIYVGTRSGGINKINEVGEIEVFDKERGLKSNYILRLYEDGERIIAATNRGGITILDSSGNIEIIDDYGENIIDVVNFNISRDSKERLWITSSKGLYLLQDTSLKKVKIDENLFAEAFFDLIDDGSGSFWITTILGLVQLDANEVDAFLRNDLPQVAYKIYDKNDGMPSKECTAATRSLIDSNNKIWIPTNGGVAVLDPNNIKLNNEYAPTYIKHFIVDDEHYNIYDSVITVKPGHIRYSIGFSALSYKAPESIQYKYKMKGVDKDWIYGTGNLREIQYTNIEPGNHTFEVFATNNDGLWNPKSAKLRFKVEPYIYQTTWFYLVLITIVVVTFLLAARWRIARVDKKNVELKKLNAELDSFVYSTSHDLRAPLLSMLGLLNIAKLDKDPTQKNSYMELMELSIKKLDSFIQDIIDYSRNTRLDVVVSAFNIKILVEDILEGLKYMDMDKLLEKHLIVEGDEKVHGDSQRIKVILNNIISNALKYYDINKEKCEVRITIKNSINELFIEVADNGIGIEKEQIKHVFDMFYRATENSKGSGIGLYIVKETIEKLGGTVHINSTHGEGTSFKVRIPTIL